MKIDAVDRSHGDFLAARAEDIRDPRREIERLGKALADGGQGDRTSCDRTRLDIRMPAAAAERRQLLNRHHVAA